MIAGPLLRWPVCAALLVGAAALVGPVPSRAGGAAMPAADARLWLQRVHQAATQRSYQGTLVVTTEGHISSSRVTHVCEGANAYERVDVLDGQPRKVLRHNDQVLTLWPGAKTARLDQRDPIPPFPALLAGSDDRLFDRYDLVDEGAGRLAGHEAAVFLLRPRDAGRFAQRVWSERSTGLLLRTDVLAADGRVLETTAFSEVTLGARGRPDTVQAVLRTLDGWQVTRAVHQRTSLDAEGWQIKVPVPGFRQTSCVKRQLGGVSDKVPGEVADVVQAIFSDGLTHVSVFIEPARADRPRNGGASTGATHTWMQQVGSHQVTVMGDVPLATLRQFAASLERKP